jgi:hypothetical protein
VGDETDMCAELRPREWRYAGAGLEPATSRRLPGALPRTISIRPVERSCWAITACRRPAAENVMTSRSCSAAGTPCHGAAGTGIEPAGRFRLDQITGPLRPATSRLTRIRTRTGEVGARHASRLHHGPGKRTTRIERVSPGWRPGALPAELHPRGYARLESNQRPLPSHGSALCPLSYGRVRRPPAGVEPAPRPYDGRVLAVDTTEARPQ